MYLVGAIGDFQLKNCISHIQIPQTAYKLLWVNAVYIDQGYGLNSHNSYSIDKSASILKTKPFSLKTVALFFIFCGGQTQKHIHRSLKWRRFDLCWSSMQKEKLKLPKTLWRQILKPTKSSFFNWVSKDRSCKEKRCTNKHLY